MLRKVIAVGVLILTSKGMAANLSQVYRDACACDPTYKAAIANFQATKQNVPLSVANFLPHISGQGQLDRQRVANETAGNPFDSGMTFYNNATTYSISAKQSLFNVANWASLAGANAEAKRAAAQLCAASQQLMIRTANAYFAVLQAYDDLRFTRMEKSAIASQLKQTKERFHVGLIAITGVHEAQASYDSQVALEITHENALANRLEELREITNKSYASLMSAKGTVPLLKPTPTRIQRWVDTALCQNYELKAVTYGMEVARQKIKSQFAGHLPQVDASAGFAYSFQDNPFGTGLFSKRKAANVAVSALIPVFDGGSVYAGTKQARFYYDAAVAEQERTCRSIVSHTRKAYLGVISGISQIRADNLTIKSRQSALKATQAAYDVGTRTMVDVLAAQSDLYLAQRNKSRNMYQYLLDTLNLKWYAGSLEPADIDKMNRWLDQRVSLLAKL